MRDLYQVLAMPLLEVAAEAAQRVEDEDEDALTIRTRAVETTDEAGSCALLGCVSV